MTCVSTDNRPVRGLFGLVLVSTFALAVVAVLVGGFFVDRTAKTNAQSHAGSADGVASPPSTGTAEPTEPNLVGAVRASLAAHRRANDPDTLRVERDLIATDEWFRDEANDPDEKHYLAARIENAELWAKKLGLAIAGATCQ